MILGEEAKKKSKGECIRAGKNSLQRKTCVPKTECAKNKENATSVVT
jgi:hypothetical protein